MFLTHGNLYELKLKSGWFILTNDLPYYTGDSPLTIELCYSFESLIGYYKKTGHYFHTSYEGDKYQPGGYVNGLFTVKFKKVNVDRNTKGYGDCVFSENKKTDNIKEFSHWLNAFVQQAEQE